VERLARRLSGNASAKRFISEKGVSRFIRVETDTDQIAEAEHWDGLHGVITNTRHIPVRELLERYRGLWQVEESFRITKHDLRVRPVFHWTPRRVRAHLAIAFMAFACVRYLAYTVATQGETMSPRIIRDAPLHRQCSLLRDRTTGRLYAVPSKPAAEAKTL